MMYTIKKKYIKIEFDLILLDISHMKKSTYYIVSLFLLPVFKRQMNKSSQNIPR